MLFSYHAREEGRPGWCPPGHPPEAGAESAGASPLDRPLPGVVTSSHKCREPHAGDRGLMAEGTAVKAQTLGQRIKAEFFKGDPPAKGSPEWLALCERMEAYAGKKLCLAKQKGRWRGWPCVVDTALGTGQRCRMHGGASEPAGPANSNWRHGRASKVRDVLPARFRESFQANVQDPELLSLRPEIAVVDERFYELLKKLDTGESARAWGQVADAAALALGELAEKDGDMDLVVRYVKQIQKLVSAGVRYGSIWTEIQAVAKSTKDLRDTESRRLKDEGAMMAAQDVLGLVHLMMDIIFKHVTDAMVLQNLLEEVKKTGVLPDMKALPLPLAG